MNKNFGIECSTHLAKQKIPSCKKYNVLTNKMIMDSFKKNTKISKRQSKLFTKLFTDCNKKVDKTLKHKQPCTLEEYIKFSGAEKKNS